jgi:release factor glutamine methyltransferase
MSATLAGLLREAAGGDAEARADAERLLLHRLGKSRTWLYAHLSDTAEPALVGAFLTAWARIRGGEPLPYVTGQADFWGRSFLVDRRVLIPRPDSECLLGVALEAVAEGEPGTIVDAGTGSGALAVSLALERPRALVLACDHSADALAVASANARRLGVAVSFWQGDWLAAMAPGSVDGVLSNPPYLAPDDVHLHELRAGGEPELALVAAEGGLADLARIAAQALRVLRPGGWLAMEHGHTQGEATRQMLAGLGYRDVMTRQDMAGRDRVVLGRRCG